MSNESTIRASLQIKTGNLYYQSQPTAFTATVTGAKGPCPGAFTVSVSGTDIDFSQLTTPGLCTVQNLDSTNYVTLGVYEPDTDFFYPLVELLPGEIYVWRWSRFVRRELTGTGTLVGYNSVIRLVANTAPVNVVVNTFEA